MLQLRRALWDRLGRLRVVVIAGAIAGAMGTAHAQSEVQQQAARLRDRSFQVRVQAALSLGASDSDQAVGPLCAAVNDDTASVRAAAAAAIGRLRRQSGVACLNARLPRESNEAVRGELRRAIERIERDAALRIDARASRPPARGSRWYVAVDATRNKTSRATRDVDLLVQATLRKGLMESPKVAVAPFGQDKDGFEGLTRQHKVQGYLLRPAVERLSYEGTNLTVALRVTLFSYPDMALRGEFAPKLSMSATSARDRDAEDGLLRMATERAVHAFLDSMH